jgi:hypothetical protein
MKLWEAFLFGLVIIGMLMLAVNVVWWLMPR